MTEGTQTCRVCGETQPLAAFCREKARRRSLCLACYRQHRRLYRAENPAIVRAQVERRRARLREDPERRARDRAASAAWKRANAARLREHQARWRAAHPDYQRQWRARQAARQRAEQVTEATAREAGP
jgi:hypothetical protein